MADVKLNFSSQWPTIQVAMVIDNPTSVGEDADFPYAKKIKHNLGYPPFAISMSVAAGSATYTSMVGVDVDDTYVYVNDDPASYPEIDCLVVYSLNIEEPFIYPVYDSVVGDVLTEEYANDIDLRKFLLHSRAVGPMVLAVRNKVYATNDIDLEYTSPLNYPTFSFGWVRGSAVLGSREGVWLNSPLAGQAWPVTFTDGYTTRVSSTLSSGKLTADKGAIVVLRNPAIITNNTVEVTI